MGNLKQKWDQLSRREQLYVGVGGVLVLVFLLYSFLISPLLTNVTNLKQQYNAQQNLVVWMTPRVAALAQLTTVAPTQTVNSANLLATVDAQLKQSILAQSVGEIAQANTNQVRVSLKEVSFDELTSWLVQQWQQSQIQVSDFVAQKTDKPGMVTVTMTLTIYTRSI
jgi:type II secretory pathway component PulM